MSVSLLRQLLMKDLMKESAKRTGIMTINKNLSKDVEKLLQKYISSAQSQGVDLDTLGEQQLKYIIQLNKQPTDGIPQAISANSDEGRKITEALFGKQKAPVVDMTGKTIDTSQGIMGGKSVKELMDSGQITKGTASKQSDKVRTRKMFKDSNLNETDAQIKARLESGNKKSSTNIKNNRQLTEEEIRDYELDLGDSETWMNKGTFGEAEQALKNQKNFEAKMFEEYKSIGGSKRPGGPKASERDSMPIRLMKNFEKELNEADLMAEGYSKDQANVLIKARKKMTSGEEMNPNESLSRVKEEFADNAGVDVEDFTDIDFEIDIPEYATGGRAGYYGGGQAMVGEDMSDIGHGSDSLMARNMQLAPNSQATTSTGLNYLLGQDNDTVRVPYNEGKKVEGPNPKVLELMLNEKMSYSDALKELKIREKQQPYIDQRYNMGPGPILEAAEGGRIGYKEGGPARQNFAMGKRAFLKFLGAGAAGIAGIKTGLLGLGKKEVAKEVVKEAATSGGVPPYFLKLVAKIKSLGDDVTEKSATLDRQKVTKYKEYELTEDVSTGQIEIQRMKVTDPESASYYGQALTEETYMSYKPGETIIGKGNKPVKTQPQYEEGTAHIRSDGMNAGEIVEESAGISDEIFEEIGQAIPEVIRKTKADGGRIGLFMGGGLTAGKSLAREMLKFMSKGSVNAKSPAELLQLYNSKQFNKLLDNPAYTGKISPKTGETADEMILDIIDQTKNDRSSMVGDLIGSARKIKKVDDDIKKYKQKIIKDMIDGGIDQDTAYSFADKMAKEMKENAAPQLTSSPPKITEQGLLELENIQKNLLTKDRQLQATGGLATMLGE